jgi:protein O-mannosyl-transferase
VVPPSNRVLAFGIAVIAVAILAAFIPGLHTPFQYDDLSTVVESESIRNLSDLRTVLSPPANLTPTAGRPLLSLSFAIDYAVFGLNVVGYHATNIALHLTCALLLFAIVRRSTRWPSTTRMRTAADFIAAASATIWAVHPLQTGAVTYISGRSDVLMTVWYFTTLLFAMRAYRSPHGPAWATASVFTCAVGMACKESMVTAPIAVLLYDRAYLYNRFSDAVRERWRLYGALATTWVIVVGLSMQGPRSDTAGLSTGISPWVYLLNQTLVIPQYIRLVVWPDYLLFAYGEARRLTLSDVGAVSLIVPAAIGVTLWLWIRRPTLGFLAVWVFVTLAPTSSIIPIATEGGAARRMYLPLAGIAVLFVIGLVALGDWMQQRRMTMSRRAPLAMASAIAVALIATTAAQNREFASAEQLWRGSLERWPSALAYKNLAAVLLQHGRRTEAIEQLRAASALDPRSRYALGVQLFDGGRPAEAIPELQRVILEFPEEPTIAIEGRRVLARALQHEGRHREAAAVWGQVAAMVPGDIAPRLSQADALLAAGDLLAAHQGYQQILTVEPGHLGALTNDGLTLLRLGRGSEALPLLERAAEQQPHDAAAYMNLASASAAVGRISDAVAAVCHALTEAPRDPRPRQFLEDLRRAAANAHLELPACTTR